MTEIPNDFSYSLPESRKIEKNITAPHMIDVLDLNFSYDEEAVLSDINISIDKGTFLGIAGPSGCGKSSFIKTVCKLEKAEGKIYIVGKDIDTLSRKKANLEDFVNSLPEGLDTVIAEHGSNLSGGQKQRIAIARIFLRKPQILILDEATSALDNTSEKLIQNEIEKLKQENQMTILSIAHRLTTLKNCDNIIVINHGKIVQSGRYDELLEKDGIFSDMCYGRLK